MNDDHNTTPEEMLECALIQQMEQIQAYMEKFNREQSNGLAIQTNGQDVR